MKKFKFKIKRKIISMGVDCSFHSTGIAVLKGSKLIHTKKLVKGKEEKLCRYLNRLRREVTNSIELYEVDYVAMEELNFSSNFKTSTALLRAQGAIMSGVYEVLTNEVEMYHNMTWRSKMDIKRPKYEHKIVDVKNRKTGKITKSKKKIKEKVMLKDKKVDKDIKYMTIIKVNEMYKLNLGYDDNDIADAIGIVTTLSYDIKKLIT